MPKFHDDGRLAIRRDPTAAELAALRERTPFGDVRAVLDEAGTLYVWDGNVATHAAVAADIGLDGLRLDIVADRLIVVLAGGALETLDGREKVADFFSRHGHPGATLADRAVLIEIAEQAMASIRASAAIRRAMPGLATIEADIDPRIDWAAKVIGFADRVAADGLEATAGIPALAP